MSGLPGALLPILHAIQDAFGHVPAGSVPLIANGLNLRRAEVHGVISFYHHFHTAPTGRTVVQVCRAESCQAKGGALLEANGVEIARAKISLLDRMPFDTHAFVAHRSGDLLRWTAVSIPGHEAERDHVLDASEVERVRFPAEFLRVVLPLVEEGTSLVVTELPIVPHTTGAPLTVLAEAQTEAGVD